MTTSRKISRWKEVKFWLISFLILAILFETVSSIFFIHRYATKKPAIIHMSEKFTTRNPGLSLYHKVHELVRPDSAPSISRQIADQMWEANKYSYEPWLQFKVANYKSKYVNIKGFERKSVPAEFINSKSDDSIDIYFMGGSTMYGYNVSDSETIPSQFLRKYKNKYPGGKSIRIRNFGIPYYYSKQELLLLSKLIFEERKPDAVVFLDGLNDFYPSRMLFYDYPHFSYAMQQVFDDKLFRKTKTSIIDTSDRFYIDPPGIPAKEYYQELLNKYLNNIEYAQKVAGMAQAKSYFFCQPVPFYNYPNRDNDPICYKVSYDRYDYIYPRLDRMDDSLNNFVFLGNMLEQEKGLPFVDQVHYSPEFSGRIAERILLKLENDLF